MYDIDRQEYEERREARRVRRAENDRREQLSWWNWFKFSAVTMAVCVAIGLIPTQQTLTDPLFDSVTFGLFWVACSAMALRWERRNSGLF